MLSNYNLNRKMMINSEPKQKRISYSKKKKRLGPSKCKDDFSFAKERSTLIINLLYKTGVSSTSIQYSDFCERIPEEKSGKMTIDEDEGSDCRRETQSSQKTYDGASENTVTPKKSNCKDTVISYVRSISIEELDHQYSIEQNIEYDSQVLRASRKPYFVYQKSIDPRMRTILLDWIMEVCEQLSFKRSTYHSSVTLVDLFLSKVDTIQTNQLQLVGVTALVIAAKNEEIIIPTIETFAHSTDYAYSTREILNYEKFFIQTLQWKIQYPVLSFWGNYITQKWDYFCDAFNLEKKSHLLKFRNKSPEAYYLFRNFFQIIDAISLDYEYFQWDDKVLAIATLYLLMGLSLKCFSLSIIINEFAFDSRSYSEYYNYNLIFNRFLNSQTDCELDDVVEHIQYVSFFFRITFDYNEPVFHVKPNDEQNNIPAKSYEDYLQIQTHNPHNINSIENIVAIRMGLQQQ